MKTKIFVTIGVVIIVVFLVLPKVYQPDSDWRVKENYHLGAKIQTSLEEYKNACGSYPTTSESLAILLTHSCDDRYIPNQNLLEMKFENKFGESFQYSSDGVTYELKIISDSIIRWTPTGRELIRR